MVHDMQATLGRKGDYSVRAVLDIATHNGVRRKAREIAEEMDIPSRYLPQILANLVEHGLLTAEAGPTGGYVLARPAESITLLDVVEAAERPIRLDQCVLRGGPCDWDTSCPIHVPWNRALDALTEQLTKTTFEELTLNFAEIAAGTYELPPDLPPHVVPTPRMSPNPPADGAGR
jgi:Rrf2 family protein